MLPNIPPTPDAYPELVAVTLPPITLQWLMLKPIASPPRPPTCDFPVIFTLVKLRLSMLDFPLEDVSSIIPKKPTKSDPGRLI